MATYEDYEVSVEGSQPVELYKLVLGSSVWYMCNAIDTINWGGNDYIPTIVRRGRFMSGQEALEVTLPSYHDFPSNYATVAPGQTATLTIYRYQREEPTDVQVRYKGVVRSVAFSKEGRESKLHLIPITDTFDKMIPDMTYQASCNHVLYDTKCQVLRSSFEFVGTPSVETGNVLTVPGLTATKGAGWADAGYVAFGVLDFRLVLSSSGDNLTLILPFYETVVGQSVNVYAGCDHSIEGPHGCDLKFSNHINFGGCPYVPTKNIFISGV